MSNDQKTGVVYGYHIGKGKTLTETVNRFVKNFPDYLGCFQIFLASPKSYKVNALKIPDYKKAKDLLDKHGKRMFIHANYCLNLCGSTNPDEPPEILKEKESKIMGKLLADLDIAVILDVGTVVHFGTNKNKEFAMKRMILNLRRCFEMDSIYTDRVAQALGLTKAEVRKKRRLILENSAGEGTKLGSTLPEIAEIIKAVPYPITICIDTCHIFGAGQYHFGIESDIKRFFRDFDELIGLDKLEYFHLNDSLEKYGSNRDCHACLGDGYIFGKCVGYSMVEIDKDDPTSAEIYTVRCAPDEHVCSCHLKQEKKELAKEGIKVIKTKFIFAPVQAKLNSLKYLFAEASRRGISIIGETPDGREDLKVLKDLGIFGN